MAALGLAAAALFQMLCAGLGGGARAQVQQIGNPAKTISPITTGSLGFSRGSVVVAPVPFQSPSLDTGLALGGAYLFKADEQSDSSSIGGGAFKTTNGSEGFGVGWNLSFAQGVWSTNLLYAEADLNYDLYARNGTAFPIGQTVRGLSLGVGRKIAPSTKISAQLGYGVSTIFRQAGSILPPEFLPDRNIEIARFSIAVDRDLRDDNFYPTTGSHFDATLTTGHFLNGRERTYAKAVVLARRYIPVWESGVLAGQFALCGAGDSAPFFDACALGGVDAFRGYPATEFIGDALTSAQLEYRGRLTKRLGFVVFAGAGLVADDLAGLSSADLKIAGGLGARIRLSTKFPVDYAIDVSVNDQSEELLYISVGQRF